MTTEAYDFQILGARAIKRFGGRALLSDEMGLGKSLQWLLFLHRNPELRPAVVVCPASLKFNWEQEAFKHFGMRMQVLEGTRPHARRGARKSQLYAVSYNILGRRGGAKSGPGWGDWLKEIKPQAIALDECQAVSNRAAMQTKWTRTLCRGVPSVVGMSGTPLTNRPAELWSVLNIIRPDLFPAFRPFGEKFCDPKVKPWGLDYSGAKDLDVLHKFLTTHCFPYNTLVDTDQGPVPIGRIVNERQSVFVRSVCPESAQIHWRQVIAYSKRPAPAGMVRIVHQAGELHCTADHLVWTQEKGWQRACEITPDLHLSVVQGSDDGASPRTADASEILLGEVCGTSQGRRREGHGQDGRAEVGKATVNQDHDLPRMRGTQGSSHPEHPKVLLQQVCSRLPRAGMESDHRSEVHLPLVQQGVHQSVHPAGRSQADGEVRRGMLAGLCSVPTVGSDDARRATGLGEIHSSVEGAEEAAQSTRVARQLPGSYHREEAAEGQVPEGRVVLHVRGSGAPGIATSHRDRRPVAYLREAEDHRQGQREGTEASRVVSVEIYQRADQQHPARSCPDDQVYDIEVEGSHNFFADGVLVHNCMIRRRKEEVLHELPEKTRSVVPLPLKDPGEYLHAQRDFLGWLRKHSPEKVFAAQRAQRLVQAGHLMRLVGELKVPSVIEWVDNFLAEGKKLVLFAYHTEVMDRLWDRYKRIGVRVDGGTPLKQRHEYKEAFQGNKRVRLFLGNIHAAGKGLTLTAADTVAFAEMFWTPGSLVQCEDRVHRIGQTRGAQAVYLIAKGTCEERLCNIIQRKQQTLSAVLDGGPTGQELNVFDEFIEAVMKEGA